MSGEKEPKSKTSETTVCFYLCHLVALGLLEASGSSPVKQGCNKGSWLFLKRIFTHSPSPAPAFSLLHPQTGPQPGVSEELWAWQRFPRGCCCLSFLSTQSLDLTFTSLTGPAWPQPLPPSVRFLPAKPRPEQEGELSPSRPHSDIRFDFHVPGSPVPLLWNLD